MLLRKIFKSFIASLAIFSMTSLTFCVNQKFDVNEIESDNNKINREIDLTSVTPFYQSIGWGSLKINEDFDGNRLSLKKGNNEIEFQKGFLAHAYSVLVFNDLDKYNIFEFKLKIGINKSQRNRTDNNVRYRIYFDNFLVYTSNILNGRSDYEDVNIKADKKINRIIIEIDDEGHNGTDHSAITDPIIVLKGD